MATEKSVAIAAPPFQFSPCQGAFTLLVNLFIEFLAFVPGSMTYSIDDESMTTRVRRTLPDAVQARQ
jgi:hypothetical protein